MLNHIYPVFFARMRGVRSARNGSALLLTLMVVSLLLVITLAFTVYVRMELRVVQARVDREIARKNAVLGLQVAIGELQLQAGPDQRITASADILDQDIPVPHPKWLGVWDSWTTWLNDGIDSTYTPGRASHFRRWLISYDPDPVSTVLENLSQPSTIPNPVELLGAGTLGAGADPSQKISATKIPVNADRGGYAWWVGGENQKAFVDAVPERTSTLDDLNVRSQWPSGAPEGIAGLDALAITNREWERIQNLDSMLLPAGAQSVRDQLKGHFHDLTVQSKGVLANVRNGGLKKDLNLLLENDTLPEEYGTEDFLDNDHQGTIKTIRPLTADVPLPSGPHSNTFSEYPPSHETPIYKKPNFTSWYKLHQYYSIYKDNTGPLGQERLQGSNVPEIESFWGNNRLDAGSNPNLKSYLGFGYDVAPVVAG